MTNHKGPVLPDTPCPNCGSSDRVLKEIQLNLTQERCGNCNRYLLNLTLPGKTKTTKKKDAA